MDFQFYPTPRSLAAKAWAMFKDRDFVRVLEPSAGEGDLILGSPWMITALERGYHRGRQVPIDAIEIDMGKHAKLRAIEGTSVVGVDFMEFQSCHNYSHIILNPPFSVGVTHVLKAWDGLLAGEVVAILNAETVRNPHSAERKRFLKLIELYGEVQFEEGAFVTEETRRQTKVEIALVYLRKRAQSNHEIVGDLIAQMRQEDEESAISQMAQDFTTHYDLAIPNSVIENLVLQFNVAVKAMKDSVYASVRSSYYANTFQAAIRKLRESPEDAKQESRKSFDAAVAVRNGIATQYTELKEAAWATFLESTEVTSKLSSAARTRLQAEFEHVKKMEFTVTNLRGFIDGLMESQGELMMGMACDVFDLVSRFHSENVAFFRGWKSNDRHRTCGFRLKATRFVLPHNKPHQDAQYISCEAGRRLEDIDRVFAMLDGVEAPLVSLSGLFDHQMGSLLAGERLHATYFSARYYAGIGTIHVYPSRPDLMDKLNVMVGRHRNWIPDSRAEAPDNFWEQFEKSEKFDREVRQAIDQEARSSSGYSRYSTSPVSGYIREVLNPHGDDTDRNSQIIERSVNAVLQKRGISTEFQVQYDPASAREKQLPLLLAA